MTQFQQKLHQSLPATTLWGYNGSYPGPTIETRKGSPVQILWKNNLPSTHLLSYAIDRTLHNGLAAPDVRTVVHVHGAKVLPESDGYPEAWFTSNFAQTGPYWTTQVYKYPNDQQATTLWYHDHAVNHHSLERAYWFGGNVHHSRQLGRHP
jgi:spore coat protein A